MSVLDLEDEELSPVITPLYPLLRPITAMYFPPVPTIVSPASTTPEPSTRKVITPKPTRRGGRRKSTTPTIVYTTTTVTVPFDIQDPDFDPYYDEQLLDDLLGGDRILVPRTHDPGAVLNRTDRVPPAIGNRNGYVEIRTAPSDVSHQLLRTTILPANDQSKSSSSSISATMLVIVAGVILSTIVVIAVVITIIVLGSRKCRDKRKPTRNGNMNGIPPEKKAIQYQHKDNTLYFMAANTEPGPTPAPMQPNNNTGSMRSVKSSKGSKNSKSNGTSKERMALVSGRDVNHEGPLKMYKWDDF